MRCCHMRCEAAAMQLGTAKMYKIYIQETEPKKNKCNYYVEKILLCKCVAQFYGE